MLFVPTSDEKKYQTKDLLVIYSIPKVLLVALVKLVILCQKNTQNILGNFMEKRAKITYCVSWFDIFKVFFVHYSSATTLLSKHSLAALSFTSSPRWTDFFLFASRFRCVVIEIILRIVCGLNDHWSYFCIAIRCASPRWCLHAWVLCQILHGLGREFTKTVKKELINEEGK